MDKLLNRRYLQLIFLCFFAYMISYIGKLGYTANIQNFIDSYETTKLEAGYASSTFFFCYGAGQFINAIFCEKVNSIKIVSLSLFISSLFTLSLFFIKNMIVIAVLWGINGLTMSTLWCNIVKITAQIKDEKYLKKSIIALSMTVPVGTFFTYGLSSLLSLLGVWKIYFIIATVIVLSGSVIFLIFTTKATKDIERLYVQKEEEKEIVKETVAPEGQKSLFKYLSYTIIPVIFICVVCNIIKDGVQTWMPTFLKENYDMPTYFSILLTLCLPLVGIFSAMIGKSSMYKIKNEYVVSTIVFVLCALMLGLFILIGDLSAVIAVVVFAILSLLMHIVNGVFTSIVPVFYKSKIKSGQAAGILNGFAYVGSTLSSFMLGGVVDAGGWNMFIYVLLGCTALAFVCGVLAFFSKRIKERKEK